VTFSIVARDNRTGRFGVAVSSCVLAVGARVPAVRAGVGAVVVQAGGELPWRAALLDLLDRGLTAHDAVAALQAAAYLDASQVAVVGTAGPAATFTGDACDDQAGGVAAGAVSAQANTMASADAWPAMVEAFHRSDDFVAGLLDALAAADATGGDLRGRQSAAVLVTSVERGTMATGNADDPVLDLRVDDSRDPVGELTRLVRVERAHRRLVRASTMDDPRAALDEARRAAAEAPDDPLCSPAAGIALALAGETDEGLALIRHATTVNPDATRWARERGRAALTAGNSAAEALLRGLERLAAETR
jgi:uncharacterized Ntn-hydrolase superfamily protein